MPSAALQVSFLAELPALKGLSPAYLRSLAHCFHQVQFEPREVLVRQGDVSDCLYVLKSGQVRQGSKAATSVCTAL
jgi:CRP-like cAMP-binding protein